ncbi:MAG TPA: DUF3047 domain-containing protein, partial [Burkholderiaceae bacterium]
VVWAAASPARAADCAARELPRFDATGDTGWRHVPLSRLKRDTAYSSVSEDGKPVLQATAQGSASAWVHLERRDISATPLLEWRWRVPALIDGAANEDPKREDSPARVIIGFDGDKSKLPEAEQRYMARIKTLSGRDMPYAMLMYIWDNKNPVGTVVPSAHTTRVKMIVAESGGAGVGAWRSYRRDLAQDFQRAFGEQAGPALGFALMTDTDNTGQRAQAFYGALRLACAGAK